MTLRVDPEAFWAAGRTVTAARDAAADDIFTAAWALTGYGAMAGSDAGGRAWAASYDGAAAAVLTASSQLITGLDQVTYLLNRTGANYAAADHASTPTAPTAPTAPAAATAATAAAAARLELITGSSGFPGTTRASISMPAPPSAAGGSGGAPPGWHLIEGGVGYLWPNGHQDKLRGAAAAWDRAAAGLQHHRLTGVTGDLAGLSCPELHTILATTADLDAHTDNLTHAYTSMATACTDYATHLDQAHNDIVGELAVFLAESAAITAAGALLTIISAGLSDAAAATAVGARCAAAAARISTILTRLNLAVANTRRTIDAAAATIARTTHTITTIAHLRIDIAAVRTAPHLARISRLTGRTAPIHGLGRGTARRALIGMPRKGGHAVRHLRDRSGFIERSGSLDSQVVKLRDLVTPILGNPSVTFRWNLGTTPTTAFGGLINGRWVVVFVAREGKYSGKIVTAFEPDAAQLTKWGMR